MTNINPINGTVEVLRGGVAILYRFDPFNELSQGTAETMADVDAPGLAAGAYYKKDAVLHPMPAQPSRYHSFDYVNEVWVDQRTSAYMWNLAKARRFELLSSSDWVVTKALETGEPMPTGWATYRQALRDITLQTDPFNIAWPVAPA